MNDRELTTLQMGDIVRLRDLTPLSSLIEGARILGIDPRDLLVTGAVVARDKPTEEEF